MPSGQFPPSSIVIKPVREELFGEREGITQIVAGLLSRHNNKNITIQTTGKGDHVILSRNQWPIWPFTAADCIGSIPARTGKHPRSYNYSFMLSILSINGVTEHRHIICMSRIFTHNAYRTARYNRRVSQCGRTSQSRLSSCWEGQRRKWTLLIASSPHFLWRTSGYNLEKSRYLRNLFNNWCSAVRLQ